MAANRSKTGYVLLGLLNEENLTGYEIKKIVDTRLSFFGVRALARSIRN